MNPCRQLLDGFPNHPNFKVDAVHGNREERLVRAEEATHWLRGLGYPPPFTPAPRPPLAVKLPRSS